METAHFIEVSVSAQKIKRCHSQEDINLNNYRHENLKKIPEDVYNKFIRNVGIHP
jgi:hypothetical protein